MCDSCGEAVHRIMRKTCPQCGLYFCRKCLVGSRSCRKCNVFANPVMEKRQLESLTVDDLWHFVRTRYITNVSRSAGVTDLVECILGWQARDLSAKAEKAHVEWKGRESSLPLDTTTSKVESEATCSKHGFDVSQVTTLDDLQEEGQVQMLSVKQLKYLLQRSCVNYKGCVEKHELMERVARLWKDRQSQKVMEKEVMNSGDVDAESAFLCKICMDAPVDCVLLECGHMLSCVKCGRQLAECPMCRQYVSRVVHAFRV